MQVLQRDSAATRVWGFGQAGAQVTVALDGTALPGTTVGSDGIWRAALPPTGAGGPHTVTLTCGSSGNAALNDVLFGDVSNLTNLTRSAQTKETLFVGACCVGEFYDSSLMWCCTP